MRGHFEAEMRRIRQILVDVLLIALATMASFMLRADFTIPADREGMLIYVAVTSLVGFFIVPAVGIDRSVWRFSGLREFYRILLTCTLVIGAAIAAGFLVNRLDGVSRSLPALQLVLLPATLIGVRVLLRLKHATRGKPVQLAIPDPEAKPIPVLVVGVGRLCDLYLRSVAEVIPSRVKVVGVLGRDQRDTGRFIDGYPILGRTEDIGEVLRNLDVHGVGVERIVIAMPTQRLTEAGHKAILDTAKAACISVEYLGERLGLEPSQGDAAQEPPQPVALKADPGRIALSPDELKAIAVRPYWRLKRALDIVGASILAVFALPLMPLLAVLVVLDVGAPILFFQQRPGLGGRPFRVFKFRTMRHAFDRHGVRLADDQRVSWFGTFLRRTRLDELPQLYNILVGDMSFVGPRPLLPHDQIAGDITRLLIRPGLTGWAQVSGGRTVSIADKVMLDLWYLHNASLGLDYRIFILTVKMVLQGEQPNPAAVRRAYIDLRHLTQTLIPAPSQPDSDAAPRAA